MNEDIFAELEDEWAGGVADFGDQRAAIAIQNVPGYTAYVKKVRDEIRKKYGSSITVYRSMSPDAFEDWANGGFGGPMGVSTRKDVALNWKNFAAVKQPQIVVQFKVTPEMCIMRGKEAESELVIDQSDVSFHLLRVIAGKENVPEGVRVYEAALLVDRLLA